MKKQYQKLSSRIKHHADFYQLSSSALMDFILHLPMTIISQGATSRSWQNSMKRIEMGRSFRDFMLSNKTIDNSGLLNQ